MSATQTTTAPSKEASPAPDFTVLNRVACIPIIASSLNTIDGALSSNTYTRAPYSTAKDISNSAYEYSGPLRMRLELFIVQADTLANKAVNAVESRYPYPFQAKPEEVATLVREKGQSAADYANNNIKTPAINAAQGIDQRFSPIVDYFEVAVSRLNNSEAGPSTPPDAKYQYQRAFALSKTLKRNVYVYSNEQLKHLQTQNALAQRATETAQSITSLASSSVTSAQTRIHELSDNMLVQLQKLQSSTTTFSASIQSSVHNTTAQIQNQIPPQFHKTYVEVTNDLSAAVTELRTIIAKKEMAVQEKVTRVAHEVQDRVGPLLETLKRGLSELLARGKKEASHTNGAVSRTSNSPQ